MNYKIITLQSDNKHLIQQAAQLLVDAFHEHWPEAWSTFDDALKEVHEMLEAERICRAAVDEQEKILGTVCKI